MAQYFPPPDAEGGWRTASTAAEARAKADVDRTQLDRAFEFAKETTKNGGLLVVRNGWLVYEEYFGLAHRDATANTGSIGKSFTSIAVGILLHEHPDRFPNGLDQLVYDPALLPPEAFPPADERRKQIRLGHLLTMTAGIRGNNPGIVEGREVTLDPAGPDGWIAMEDFMSFGHKSGSLNTGTLWCAPGEGWSYATSSIHLASTILRHVTGVELEDYVRRHIAEPLGWGHWGWGYKHRDLAHTPGGGGIAPRPTDMLRFCYLLLHEGRWRERQLVPAEYVRQAGKPSPYNPHTDYSLQFNINAGGAVPDVPPDAFWKVGSGGHCIYVVPSLNLVIFKMGGRDGQFSSNDTGVIRSTPTPRSSSNRAGWKSTYGNVDPYGNLLHLVVAATQP
jgi:CubicO group peptidase (beta-lactamase class C family)